jgi:nicotinamide-nucleotide amidase
MTEARSRPADALSFALGADVEARVRQTLEAACAAELSIATAESCTGGLVASLLTDVEGASHAFERGFVVYTDAAKTEALGVPAELIAAESAVSRAVALAMAEGALARAPADVAFAVTGFAGPAGPDDEEGLVHFACARRGGSTAHREAHYGPVGRTRVRIECVRVAMEMIGAAISEERT